MKTNFLKTGGIILVTAMGLMSCSKTDSGPSGPITSKSVATLAPEKVTTTTAYIRGTINGDVAGNIIESGIYLSVADNILRPDPSKPSGLNGKKFAGVNSTEGKFFVSLTNLKADTKYTYMAFATTLSGTVYGDLKTLVTSYSTVNDIDGNQYQTVRLGSQIWMRENLKSEHYADQSSIAGLYKLETDMGYGKHYTWNAVNNITPGTKSGTIQGVCPTGWHIPGDGEWQKLLTYVGVPSAQLNSLNLVGDEQAQQLKDAGADYWCDETVDNRTGFSVLPSGIVSKCDHPICCQAAFWTSTPSIFYGFPSGTGQILRGNHPGCDCGLSVRCVKD